MFRTEKTMFRPPGDVRQAARILGKNNAWPGCFWATFGPGPHTLIFIKNFIFATNLPLKDVKS